MLNVCACGAVVYQKHRVRQREDNLRRRIKRLSDAGMIRPGSDANESGPRYCVSNDGGHVCNNDDEDDEEDCDNEQDSDACSHDGHHFHHPSQNMYVIANHSGLNGGYPVRSALRQPQRMIDMSYDDHLIRLPGSSNTSSLARDLRFSSRSMGNNLDSLHAVVPAIGGPVGHVAAGSCNSTASRSIAALDVLPRSDPSVIFNQHGLRQQPPTSQSSRRSLLPRMDPGLCHSLRSRLGSNTTSSASGSRPPSPIIEVIPVSEYETMYGSLSQASPIYSPQYSSSGGGGASAVYNPTGVVYPAYNTSRMSSTLPMSSSQPIGSSGPATTTTTVTTGNSSLRQFDYAPRGNFAAKPLRPQQYWGSLQHRPSSMVTKTPLSSGMLLQPSRLPLSNLQQQQARQATSEATTSAASPSSPQGHS